MSTFFRHITYIAYFIQYAVLFKKEEILYKPSLPFMYIFFFVFFNFSTTKSNCHHLFNYLFVIHILHFFLYFVYFISYSSIFQPVIHNTHFYTILHFMKVCTNNIIIFCSSKIKRFYMPYLAD